MRGSGRLGKSFSDFHEACPILNKGSDERLRPNRLALARLTGGTLAAGLGLLGLRAPPRM